MRMALLAAERGTCSKAKVGCVIVSNNWRVLATGYNSSFPGTAHCIDEGCLELNNHCMRCLHAEEAAILSLECKHNDMVAFITHAPCIHCYKILVNAGVKQIFYGTNIVSGIGPESTDRDKIAGKIYRQLRKEIGICVTQYKIVRAD